MKLTHKAAFGTAFLAVCGFSAPCAHAQTYDAANDFSATNNPNGVWSYGYETTLGGTFNLYTDEYAPTAYVPTTDIKGWNHNISLNVPLVQKNFSSAQEGYLNILLQPNQLVFHPGPDNEYSVVRFTTPQTGSYSLSSGFTPVSTAGTTTDVHILENGTSLFSGEVTGTYNAPNSAPTFSSSMNLTSGDIVDFAVGYGTNGNFLNDSTGLAATLSTPAVPETSSLGSLGLLLLLGGGLVWSARRRTVRSAE